MTVHLPGLPAIGRAVAGILFGGVVAAIVFLIMVQGSFRRGYTDFDFAHILGTAIQGTAEEQRSAGDALGVIGDTAGPTALYATLIAGVCLLAVHALVVRRVVKAHWLLQGIVLGLVAFLAIGVIYVPYADANLDTPIGAWGVDQGGFTPVVLLLSSIGASIVGARCYDLAARTSWWRDEGVEVTEQLTELTGVDAQSLELAEERREQGTMRS